MTKEQILQEVAQITGLSEKDVMFVFEGLVASLNAPSLPDQIPPDQLAGLIAESTGIPETQVRGVLAAFIGLDPADRDEVFLNSFGIKLIAQPIDGTLFSSLSVDQEWSTEIEINDKVLSELGEETSNTVALMAQAKGFNKIAFYKALITAASFEEPFLKPGLIKKLIYPLGFFLVFFGSLWVFSFFRESNAQRIVLLRDVAAYQAIAIGEISVESPLAGRVARRNLKTGTPLSENDLFDKATSESLKNRIRISVSINPLNIPDGLEPVTTCLLIISPAEKEGAAVRIDGAVLLETEKEGERIKALIALTHDDLEKLQPVLAKSEIYLAVAP